jgi:DNA-binding CsgD family transcriptional regulator
MKLEGFRRILTPFEGSQQPTSDSSVNPADRRRKMRMRRDKRGSRAVFSKLTPAEARIALGIARGDALAAIAEAHGISIATARTQLKSVFAKTGTHRQGQLVALLAGTIDRLR